MDTTSSTQSGVSYIAQVLKRNQTLKVLNLSDNKIDAAGLQSLAQALVSGFQWNVQDAS